ncbi:uncharacterized protein LOC112561698 [Pomacea canaliculata]|uniref:uncharacterized protein LOC112561698 n=1 Tax=Pomacea canaliculata TaxID=400727 RepID=UPI000D73EB69|nr:uncharacterized protein LOC112561698 [Pomacea canaliculata]
MDSSKAARVFLIVFVALLTVVCLTEGCAIPHKAKQRRSKKPAVIVNQEVKEVKKVICYSGADCIKRRHCVRGAADDDFGYCQPFLRTGHVCTVPAFTAVKPHEIVNERRCGVGLVCTRMGHRNYPHEKHCTSLS